jgi:hypothetical protein
MFLAELADCASVTMAAARSGINRTALYRERERSKRFAAKWDKACDLGVERLQDDAMRRALQGDARPVIRDGEQVAVVQRHDTGLLKFLLQSHRPEVYGARRDAAAPALPVDLIKRVAAAEKRAKAHLAEKRAKESKTKGKAHARRRS